MFIYKITNLVNHKIYIGQTTKTIDARWKRHQYDAITMGIQTHLGNAIRKYGVENFKVEEIEEIDNKDDLNDRERYWIEFYNSCVDGYNLTDGGDGGNTYQYKTVGELAVIKEKLHNSKTGGKNPNSRKVKCLNEETKEEHHFDTVSELQAFLGAPNHNAITRRCTHKTKCLYNKLWNIAYEEDDYFPCSTTKNSRKAKAIKVRDLNNNTVKQFPSFSEAERFYGMRPKAFSGKAFEHPQGLFIVQQRYEIEVLGKV